MASEERRSTLHMPLWVQSVGEKIIQETLLQHFELIKEYAKLDPSLKLWRVSRYWQADYKYFSKQNVSHVGTLLIPNHETRQQLFPRLAWSVCPSVTWQFYVLIHRQNRRLTVIEGRGYPLTDGRTYLSFHNSSFALRYLFHVNGKVGAWRVHYAPGTH
jgi:hypothetical protein